MLHATMELNATPHKTLAPLVLWINLLSRNVRTLSQRRFRFGHHFPHNLLARVLIALCIYYFVLHRIDFSGRDTFTLG